MKTFERDIEIEYKSRIDKNDYTLLMETYKNKGSIVEQTNYYFDTPDYYYNLEKNATIRIREKEGTYTLTIKSPGQDAFIEESTSLTGDEFKDFINHGITKKDFSLDKHVYFMVSLTTIRFTMPYKNGLICIDKSHYLKHVDYEIEYETSHPKHKLDLEDFLSNHHIEKRPISGKRFRALNENKKDNDFML